MLATFYREQGSLLQAIQKFPNDAKTHGGHNRAMKIPVHGAHLLRKGRHSQTGGVYFITMSTYQRIPRFTDFWLAYAMSRQMQAVSEIGSCKNLCWVVMPDHVHVLVQLGELPLSRVVQRLKSRSAVMLNRERGVVGRFWSKGYYDHALRRSESIKGVSDYIIYNPVRAGLVKHPADYPFWNAAWL